MDVVDKISERVKQLPVGAAWGMAAGFMIGLGILCLSATGIGNVALIPLIAILGSSSVAGLVLGNAVESIIDGKDAQDRHAWRKPTHVSQRDLENTTELVDHLKLREQEIKARVNTQAAMAFNLNPAPPVPGAKSFQHSGVKLGGRSITR